MPPIIKLPDREPAALIGGGAAALTAIIAVLGHFVPISDALRDDLVSAAVAVAVVAVVTLPLIRAKVTPNARVSERVDDERIIAGPANDQRPAGSVVREVGSPAPRRAIDDDGDNIPDFTPH